MTDRGKPTPTPDKMTGPERRQQIIAASREVFARTGLAGTRTKQLAEAAGVAEALIFKHFSSKEELFTAAILEPLETILADLRQQASEFRSSVGPERAAIAQQSHAHFLEMFLDVLPLLGIALFSDRDAGRRFYKEQLAPIYDAYSDSLAESLAESTYQGPDPALLARIFLGSHFALCIDSIYGDQDLNIEATSSDLAEFMARGIGLRRRRRSTK